MTMWIEDGGRGRMVLDEDVVDYGLGTPEDQAAAAARIATLLAEVERTWKALPLWYRAWVRLEARTYEPRYRIRHAIAALRGRECP